MIKTTELRIGNRLRPRRVLDPENIPISGYSICAVHIAYSEEELNHDWEPIPLTPEVLEKSGFEIKDNSFISSGKHHEVFIYLSPFFGDWKQNRLQCRLYNDRDPLFWLVAESGPTPAGTTVIGRLQYLHQLQNLYFALTGEELNVNL